MTLLNEKPVFYTKEHPVDVIERRGGTVELVKSYLALYAQHKNNPEGMEKAMVKKFSSLNRERLLSIFQDFKVRGFIIRGVQKDGSLWIQISTTQGISVGDPEKGQWCSPEQNRQQLKKIMDMLRSKQGGFGQVPYNKNEKLSKLDKPTREILSCEDDAPF